MIDFPSPSEGWPYIYKCLSSCYTGKESALSFPPRSPSSGSTVVEDSTRHDLWYRIVAESPSSTVSQPLSYNHKESRCFYYICGCPWQPPASPNPLTSHMITCRRYYPVAWYENLDINNKQSGIYNPESDK